MGRRTIRFGACALLLAAATPAMAQQGTWPAKPVRIVVGFAPGGASDIVGRIVAQRLAEGWGQSVIVENRPGASGMIGAEAVARSAPDGYTLLASPQTSMVVAPQLYAKVAYDPVRDFVPVTLAASAPMLLVVHPSLPARTFQQFVAIARARPGQLTFGSGGIGAGPHMVGELVAFQLGLKLVHVPYKGEGPAATDAIGGQIISIFGTLPAVLPHAKTGRLRGIAVTTAQRTGLAPGYPTIAESGIPGFDAGVWIGLFAPAGTPRELVARIQADTARLLGTPEARERLAQAGLDFVANTPEQFAQYHRDDLAKWGKVIRAAGIRPD